MNHRFGPDHESAKAPMRYYALATDYDGTLARDGRVNEDTIRALERLRETGREAPEMDTSPLGDDEILV